jgi:hypothetical protein
MLRRRIEAGRIPLVETPRGPRIRAYPSEDVLGHPHDPEIDPLLVLGPNDLPGPDRWAAALGVVSGAVSWGFTHAEARLAHHPASLFTSPAAIADTLAR